MSFASDFFILRTWTKLNVLKIAFSGIFQLIVCFSSYSTYLHKFCSYNARLLQNFVLTDLTIILILRFVLHSLKVHRETPINEQNQLCVVKFDIDMPECTQVLSLPIHCQLIFV